MSQWLALSIIVGCLMALLAFWLLRNYTAPWLTCISRIAVSMLLGWPSLLTFIHGWENSRLNAACRGCRGGGSYITFDHNPIEFVFSMSVFAGASLFALGYLLYHFWWLILIVQARFR